MGKNVVHFLPAESGDCSVIELDNKECILIDCGFKATYHNKLKPLLLQLRAKGCKIILMIVSHIDQDHIEGAIELLTENGSAQNPNIIEIDNIWFNGFFNSLFIKDIFTCHKNKIVSETQKKQMRVAKGSLYMRSGAEEKKISAQQSKQFEELCSFYGYRLNMQFRDRIVKYINEFNSSKISIGECNISVLSPGKKQLDSLAAEFDKEMVKMFGKDYAINNSFEFATLFELLMGLYKEEVSDTSYISAVASNIENWLGTSNLAKMNVINKASIVVEIEYKNKRFLFTGDSDSELWWKHLKEDYDVIKISHHGTTKPNIKLIEHSRGKHVLISTNGKKYGHPEKDLIARVILGGNLFLHFNYEVEMKKIIENIQEKYKFKAEFCNSEITID
ncbi:MBL fold metallo-hydrolase [Pectinatus haikarae]|uniref:MBL fold metallo-hydrolase n=1 Tax=Pectinatus haikarae TaxID=349096 RepID=UPI0018C46F7C|nr:MBL fold metallo-hydrolase [Pectinatus haikarae]